MMKKLSVISFAALAALMVMMNSCLNDGENTWKGNYYGYIGPADGLSGRTVFKVSDNDYPIYSSSLSSLEEGYYSCYVEVDNNSEQNQNSSSKGYLEGSVAVQFEFNMTNVDERFDIGTDTITVIENEQPVYQLLLRNFVNKGIMLAVGYDKLKKDQRNSHTLSFYRDEELGTYDKYNVYNLYLRSTVAYAGTGSSTNADYNYEAFPLHYFYNYAVSNERSKEKDGFFVRIKYVSEIDEETQEITWEEFPTLIGVAIPE